MPENKELEKYKRDLKRYLDRVAPIFAKAAVGDFSDDVQIPPKESELTIYFVGVQMLLEAIREKIKESDAHLAQLNTTRAELEQERAASRTIGERPNPCQGANNRREERAAAHRKQRHRPRPLGP